MSDSTLYVARKGPFSRGSFDRAFDELTDAKEWLNNLIEWEMKEQGGAYPGWLFEVVEGTGNVAGTIREVQYDG
jgi:hypothetical protein